ncbi:hypothetical protein ABIE26_003233 [Pedobacter africanus]|uniref:Uncharacterized protein n=1 Tax=Pedobacter africanus TaxID=151894 RepID=A0ACC6KZ98_9SPHI|nr:hypothetical protein [Pedobacter africanus]
MNKPIELTIYLNHMNIGSLVLKAPKQYYKVNGLLDVLPLAGELQQFIRSVAAGATPHSLFNLADLNSSTYEFELRFAGLLYLVLRLKTADNGKVVMFEWNGSFGDFRDGFKVF